MTSSQIKKIQPVRDTTRQPALELTDSATNPSY